MNERAVLNLCRDQPCYVRLEGICGDPATVVPAHFRMIGISGAGMKSPPIMVCPSCQNCHDAIDRRRYMDLERDFVQLAHLRGIMRWQKELWNRGIIKV